VSVFNDLMQSGKSLMARMETQIKSGTYSLQPLERVIVGEAEAWLEAVVNAVQKCFGNESAELRKFRSDMDTEYRRVERWAEKGYQGGHGDWRIHMIGHAIGLIAPFQYDLQLPKQPLEGGDPMPKPTIRLFISHSSRDSQLAERLIHLIESALKLSSTAIRCTSIDGYRLPAGAKTDEQLRREVHEAEAFVGIISSESVQSMYVLFELGARWGAGRHLIPLLAPGASTSTLAGPLAGLNALRSDNSAQLQQLVTDIASVLSIPTEPPAAYQRYLDQIMTINAAPAEAVLPPAKKSLHSVASSAVKTPRDQLRFLQVFTEGKERITRDDLAGAAGIKLQKAQYYLDALIERHLIATDAPYGIPPSYWLTEEGRALLVEKGLL